ncbi:MAG: GNAT family N-acetyltransferase [Pseudomonadota bacterium]
MDIAAIDLDDQQFVALIEAHLAHAFANSPAESVHAMALGGLSMPGVTVWGAKEEGTLVGIGALKELSADSGEIKSMHTAATHRGKGVGRAMLAFLLAECRRRGYTAVSLETGANAAYAPARALYEAAGFSRTTPFASYTEDPNSTFFTLALTPA